MTHSTSGKKQTEGGTQTTIPEAAQSTVSSPPTRQTAVESAASASDRTPAHSSYSVSRFTQEDGSVCPDSSKTALEKPSNLAIRSRPMDTAHPADKESDNQQFVIYSIFLTNFKSYAGTHKIGPFDPSFSAIIGPNGSGKSNIIDSLLFAFGFRASKMRQANLSSLIHHSARHPNEKFCEVQITFQKVMELPENEHKYIPDTELKFSRKAFKDNTSKYFIGDNESTYTAVTTLLRDIGIDLNHNRFLILQGEVEFISQMKPKAANEHNDGLLEYLEDIIGTSTYKTPIKESDAEVERVNEMCIKKNMRVRLMAKEKKILELKKDRTLAFVDLENELTMKRSALYQINLARSNDIVKITQDVVTAIQEKLDAEHKNHKGDEDIVKELERQFQYGKRNCKALEAEAEAIVKELTEYEDECVKIQEKKRFLLNEQKKFAEVQEVTGFSISEAEKTIEKSMDEIQEKNDEVLLLERDLTTEKIAMICIQDLLKDKTQVLTEKLVAKQKALDPWTSKIAEKQSAIAVAQSELDILQEENDAGIRSIQVLTEKANELEKSREEQKELGKGLEVEKATIYEKIAENQKDLKKLQEQKPKLCSSLLGARQKADEAKAILAQMKLKDTILDSLMRLRDSGRINGFYGRLGDLGTIDEKFDIAISTACPALNSMVVDSVQTGQECVEYLRRNNLGRANFILMDKLPHNDLSPISTPENVPRLFDLIRSNEDKFKIAFYSVLHNTLVANDIQQANRIAYGAKRWRVVTLDGNLIDIAGTMSGGGVHVARGGMSSKMAAQFRQNKVTELEANRDELEKGLETLDVEKGKVEVSLREVEEELRQLETKIKKIELNLESSKCVQEDLWQQIKDAQAKMQLSMANQTRTRVLTKEISSLEVEIEHIKSQCSGLESDIQSLQSEIMKAGGVRLRSQKVKIDGMKGQIALLNEEISNAEVETAKAERQRDRFERVADKIQADCDNNRNELNAITEMMQNQSEASFDCRERMNNVREAVKTKREELATVKIDLNKRIEVLNAFRRKEIDLRSALELQEKTLSENLKNVHNWTAKLSKLTLISLPDLEAGDDEDNIVEGQDTDVVHGNKEDEDAKRSKNPDEIPLYTPEELAAFDEAELKPRIAFLEQKSFFSVNVDFSAVAEYEDCAKRYRVRSADLAESIATRNAARDRCEHLHDLRLRTFLRGINAINSHLKEIYQLLTEDGNAELELVDNLDPFAEGITLTVMPKGKSWTNVSKLSGGEKTLCSLALVFALQQYRPTPLYVMDEIDAALDPQNVAAVASYIKDRAHGAQFIVVSLRDEMFDMAKRFIGVYMNNGMGYTLAMNNIPLNRVIATADTEVTSEN